MSIHAETFAGSWLTDQGEAHVVLAQVTPAPGESLAADPARPWVVATLTELLGPAQRLAQIVTGTKPVILILPELALGSEDWPAIDALVRGWTRPLILIGGFGFTSGDRLRAWCAQDGPTIRRPAWIATADERKYNGGWCWVRRPNAETVCIAFLKTTAEQQHEIHVDGLDQGESSLAVHLDDLIIFPIICSDFLNIVEGQRVVQRKITRYLDEVGGTKKVLIVGLLLQKTPHEKWRTAILDIARSINSERVNVCLVNASHDICTLQEDQDRWRDYSGVYIAKGRKPYLEHFPAVRRFATEEIDGAVIRVTSTSVLGGPLRWNFTATGRHIWAVQKDYGIAANGALIESDCTDRFQFEATRALKRMTVGHGAPETSQTHLARQSYGSIETQIRSAGAPNAELICQELLYGEPGREARDHLNADTLSSFVFQLLPGMKSLGALKSSVHMVWQTDPKQRGQLRDNGHAVNVLVWCYPGLPISMRQTLQRWRAGITPHEPLVAFTKAVGAAFATPHTISSRRQDIGEAPPPKRRSADQPVQRSQIVELSLDEIEACFELEDEAAFRAAIDTCVAQGIERLTTVVEPHAG